MSLTFCLCLLALALICHRLGAAYKALWFAIAGFGLMLLVGIGLVPMIQLSATQLTNPLSAVTWHDRNSIVVLGAGTVSRSSTLGPDVPAYAYGRIVIAASAYNDCRAHGHDCNIVVSGGDPQHHGAAEAVVYGKALAALGVPQGAIVLEAKSLSTWQNAANSTRLIPADRQIVVVTSGIHLKRALLFFDHFRPDAEGLGAEGIAADRLEPELGPLQSGYNFFVADSCLHEEIGLIQYHVYSAMGWNRRPS